MSKVATFNFHLWALTLIRICFECHRDIKPGNILLSSEGQIKLADYGLTVQLSHPNEIITDVKGTVKYFSPEMHEGQYGLMSDVWAFGLTLYELAMGDWIYICKTTSCKTCLLVQCTLMFCTLISCG